VPTSVTSVPTSVTSVLTSVTSVTSPACGGPSTTSCTTTFGTRTSTEMSIPEESSYATEIATTSKDSLNRVRGIAHLCDHTLHSIRSLTLTGFAKTIVMIMWS